MDSAARPAGAPRAPARSAVLACGVAAAVLAAASCGAWAGALWASRAFLARGGSQNLLVAEEGAARSDAVAALSSLPSPCGKELDEAINKSLRPQSPRLLCLVLTKFPGGVRRKTASLETWMYACDERAFMVSDQPDQAERPPTKFVTGGNHSIPEDPKGMGFSLYPGIEADVVSLNITGNGRDCSGNNEVCWREGFLWRKIWQLYLEVYDRYISDRVAKDGSWDNVPEWFIKADDDSMVFVSHLKQLLLEREYDPDGEYYLGHAMAHNKKRFGIDAANGFISGTCIIMSRGAFRKLAEQALAKIPERTAAFEGQTGERMFACVDRLGPQEDWSTAFCMEDAGILATDLRDEQDRPLCLPWMYAEHLQGRWGADAIANRINVDKGFSIGSMLWYWHDKRQDTVGRNCCPPLDRVISFHGFKGDERLGIMYEMRKVEEAFWEAKQSAIAPLVEACGRR